VILIHAPGLAPQRLEIGRDRTVIGRISGDIVLPDPLCSLTHAEILFDGKTVRLKDLGSTNGTFQNGQRVTELVWKLGTSIQIGGHRLEFKEILPATMGPGGTLVAANIEALTALPVQFYVLVIHPPDGPPVTRKLFQARSMVGRKEGDIVLADYGCSAAHAEILFDGSAINIRDLGSTNGTWFNGERITEMLWTPGAILKIGAHMIELKEIHAAAVPRVSAPIVSDPENENLPDLPPSKSVKKPSKALLISAAALVLSVCGLGAWGLARILGFDLGGGANARPHLSDPREATVQFVWFAGPAGPTATGGIAPARIRVGPNKTGIVSVGVSEEFAGGGGNQWRTAIWLAAFNATRAVGASLADYEFNVHVGGHTDGPSAGMLTTSAMLALLRGKDILPGTTMTGTINPDGTAGPVGGIVQKMEGAKQAGLKRFGFPIGCRNHKDLKTGQDVDLIEVGRRLGLEVKEIGDINEGYEFLTRDKLPRVEPIAESEMEPNPQTQLQLRAKLLGWKSRIEREASELKKEAKATGVPPEVYGPLLTDAGKAFDAAKRDERNGFLMSALQGYVQTALSYSVATRVTTAYAYMIKGDQSGLIESIQSSAEVKGEIEAFGQELEVKAQSKTRGGQVNTTHAFTTYVKARASTMIADEFQAASIGLLKDIQGRKIQLKQDNLGTLMTRITLPMRFYDMSRIYLEFAKDLQDLIAEEGEAKPLGARSVDRAVTCYASGSAAVLAYFDALITEEAAKVKGLSVEEAQAQIATREMDYYLARKAKVLSERPGKNGPNDGVKLMQLAAASYAFLDGAKLVNKWYSLGGSYDANGGVVLENRRALTAQLELARRNAREAATRAKESIGFVPTPARLAFQVAGARREGNDSEKLTALASYWQATFWSELAASTGK
jgi:pSer/pThr/pTyr-binding forkhead associated (FHA) protein